MGGTGSLTALEGLLSLLPDGGPEVLGIRLWLFVRLLIVLAVGWIVGALAAFLLRLIIARFVKAWGTSDDVRAILRRSVWPLGLGIGALLSWFSLWSLHLPELWGIAASFTLNFATALCFIVACYRLSDLVTLRLRTRVHATETPTDDALVPLLDRALKFLIVLAGLLLALQNLGLNITTLLAGVSIGGVAVAFAAQDTIKNLFGSVVIFVDKPFRIGDWIMVDGKDGIVEEIGFRSTRLRTFANSVLILPNGRMADLTIDNMGLRRIRRYNTTLGLQYDTPPEKIEAFVTGLRQVILEHPETVKDADKMLVYFHGIDASSVNILMNIYFEVPDLPSELRAREELNLSLLRLASELGVEFAFPARSVNLATAAASSMVSSVIGKAIEGGASKKP